jgi:L-arabinose isomerase
MEHLEDFTEFAGIGLIRINAETRIAQFRQQLRWDEVAYSRNN